MKIMLIEDDIVFALLLKREIEKLGYKFDFFQYTRSEKALGQLKDVRPDIILIDHNLGGVNGVDALPIFKDLSPSSKAVIISSSKDKSLRKRALDNGADHFFIKTEKVFNIVRSYVQTLSEEKRVPKSNFASFLSFFRILQSSANKS